MSETGKPTLTEWNVDEFEGWLELQSLTNETESLAKEVCAAARAWVEQTWLECPETRGMIVGESGTIVQTTEGTAMLTVEEIDALADWLDQHFITHGFPCYHAVCAAARAWVSGNECKLPSLMPAFGPTKFRHTDGSLVGSTTPSPETESDDDGYAEAHGHKHRVVEPDDLIERLRKSGYPQTHAALRAEVERWKEESRWHCDNRSEYYSQCKTLRAEISTLVDVSNKHLNAQVALRAEVKAAQARNLKLVAMSDKWNARIAELEASCLRKGNEVCVLTQEVERLKEHIRLLKDGCLP